MNSLRASSFAPILLLTALSLFHPEAFAQQSSFKLKQGQTIVFLGDSITEAGAQPEGYISLFKLFCGVHGYDVRVINAGVSGHKSNDMLARIESDVLAHRPDWVSISCGVNDVWHGERGVPLPAYKKNMTEMVDRCLRSGASVLLLTATPIYEDLNSPENRKLRGYNEFLRELAKEKSVVLCDLFKAFEDVYKAKTSDAKVLTTDGGHMNGRGSRLMAREILRALGASADEMSRAENRWELVSNP